MAVTPGQPGMLPNLQTGKARTAGEPSRRGPQPREALPTIGTRPSVIPRPTKDQVREGPPLEGIRVEAGLITGSVVSLTNGKLRVLTLNEERFHHTL